MRIGDYTIFIQNPTQNLTLLTLLIVFTVLAYGFSVHLRGKRATNFGNMQTLRRTHSFRTFHFSPFILLFKILIIMLLFLLATDTLAIYESSAAIDTDYIILLDSSASMSLQDYPPSRLDVAKSIATDWVRLVPDTTRVGLVTFGSQIDLSVPLTFDKQQILRQISFASIDYESSGTSLDMALSYTVNQFDNYSTNSVILLITDGTSPISNNTIAQLVASNITVFAFGIGSVEQAEIELPEGFEDFSILDDFLVSYAVNETILNNLALQTAGVAYIVSDVTELADAINDATVRTIQVELNNGYYIVLLIAIMSIVELLLYARLGGL